MGSETHNSQFTQSLMLFVSHLECPTFPITFADIDPIFWLQSQTQSGNRYTPHLTRFYAALGHTLLLPLIQESLEALNVRCKAAPSGPEKDAPLRLRIGGYDRRKVMFKGWVNVENFTYRGSVGSFCVMQRDVVCAVWCVISLGDCWLANQGNPISWRQLWKALIVSPNVEPHVLRKWRAPHSYVWSWNTCKIIFRNIPNT